MKTRQHAKETGSDGGAQQRQPVAKSRHTHPRVPEHTEPLNDTDRAATLVGVVLLGGWLGHVPIGGQVANPARCCAGQDPQITPWI
jgi:hypothetical protein